MGLLVFEGLLVGGGMVITLCFVRRLRCGYGLCDVFRLFCYYAVLFVITLTFRLGVGGFVLLACFCA